MEQNSSKFRLKLNLFDGIVLVLAVAAATFLLWRTMKPEAPVVPTDSTVTSTVRYTIRFQRWAEGTSGAIQPGDQIADIIKNYEIGHVVSAEAVPAKVQVVDQQSQHHVWAELDGFEDVLVTIEAPCTTSDAAITVGGGYEIRVGSSGYFRGEGYMGSGPIVAIEEVQG